jgi:hypothetical protein
VFCTQCGQQNPDDSRFCARCGAPLTIPGGGPSGGGGLGAGGAEQTSTISMAGLESADDPDRELHAEVGPDALPRGTGLLVVKRGPNAGSRFLLDKDVTTAGRHPESDIFLDDVTVSRRHAEFSRTGDRFSVRDVGSLNGTYLNRERIDDAPLSNGDEVQIGKFRLVYFTSGGEVGG